LRPENRRTTTRGQRAISRAARKGRRAHGGSYPKNDVAPSDSIAKGWQRRGQPA
jgi:hypothetical protein